MRAETARIHGRLTSLGESVGFLATREVNDSVLSLRLEEAYRPRVDLMWSLTLEPMQVAALAEVLGRDAARVEHLPIVGIEVEGTAPSTKIMTADLVNIVALGTRLGFLVVSERGEKNIYRRAVRIVRTLKRAFGDIGVIPLEADILAELEKKSWADGASELPSALTRKPGGGESLDWERNVRTKLRAAGEGAGFVVSEPYVPTVLRASWDRHGDGELTAAANPATGETYQMRKWSDYYTGSQIDMAWLLPLPRALPELLNALAEYDETLVRDGLLLPELYDHIAVVGFEFESDAGKHAAGGLANLSAYSTIGVAISPDNVKADELNRTLKRYLPTLGLRNVTVRSAGELSSR